MAMNINPAYFWLFCGLATAGGVGYILYDQNNPQDVPIQEAKLDTTISEPSPQITEVPKTEQEKKAPDAGIVPDQPVDKTQVEVEAIKEDPPAPAFDILRVENDGSAVVAGSALPNSVVEIIDGDTVIAKAKTGSSGDFAIVLDDPLKPGPHELYIRSIPENGDAIHSLESGIINVPEGGNDLIAMVTKPGEPSRIIQKPEPAKPEEIKKTPEAPAESTETPTVSIDEENIVPKTDSDGPKEVAKLNEESGENQAEAALGEDKKVPIEGSQNTELSSPSTDEQPEQPDQSETDNNETVIAKLDEPKDPERETTNLKPEELKVDPSADEATKKPDIADPEPIKPQIPVLIEAAEVEGEKIFIAGTGEPGAVVNIYMDGQHKGSAVVGEEGAFLFEGSGGLAAGRYAVRADMLGANTSEVKARAEVSLLHKPEEITPVKPADVAKLDEPAGTKEPGQPAPVKEVEQTAPAKEVDVSKLDAPATKLESEQPAQAKEIEQVAAAEVGEAGAQKPEPEQSKPAKKIVESETENSGGQAMSATPKSETSDAPAKIAQLPETPEQPNAKPDVGSTKPPKPSGEVSGDEVKLEATKDQKPAGETPAKTEIPEVAEDLSKPSIKQQSDGSTETKVAVAREQPEPVKKPVTSKIDTAENNTEQKNVRIKDETRAKPSDTTVESSKKIVIDQADESIEVAKVEPKPIVKEEPDNSETRVPKKAETSTEQDLEPKPQSTTPQKPEPQIKVAEPEVAKSVQQAETPKSDTDEAVVAKVEPEQEPADPKEPAVDPKVEGLSKEPDGNLTAKKVQNDTNVEIVKADKKPIAMAPLKVEGENKLAEVTQDEMPKTKPGIKEIVTGSSVIIRRGDNLWRVSRRKWGQGIRYTVIFEANKDQIRDPHWIYPGQVFKIPDVKKPKNSSDNSG